jgi:glycerol-3-phosphate dehydrogenase (NAD(P)+)
VYVLSKKVGVEMPIVQKVYEVLFEHKPAQQAMHELMTRESKPENW